MAEHNPLIEARDLAVYYYEGPVFPRRRYVAGPLSLHVHAGEFVGLAGPSGSGKTSLGKALLDLIPTWDGEVYWRGFNVRRTPVARLRPYFGWVSQEPTLAFNPRRRIAETLRETLSVAGVTEATGGWEWACRQMNLDPGLAFRYPFELSAGQVQRFALIRVFLLAPDFVLLDEPTSSLDPVTQSQILDWLLTWRRDHGLAALLIAHSRRLLERLCDRVITLEARK